MNTKSENGVKNHLRYLSLCTDKDYMH